MIDACNAWWRIQLLGLARLNYKVDFIVSQGTKDFNV